MINLPLKNYRPFVFAAACAIVFPTLVCGLTYATYNFGLLLGFPEALSGLSATTTGFVLAAITSTMSIVTFERLLDEAAK